MAKDETQIEERPTLSAQIAGRLRRNAEERSDLHCLAQYCEEPNVQRAVELIRKCKIVI